MSKPITVWYENPDTYEEFQQTFYFEDDIVDGIYEQMHAYNSGQIEVDTPLFYLFTAVKYLSKLQGFQKTPNFTVMDPEILFSDARTQS